MSITEKELADGLFDVHRGPVLNSDEWENLARRAAELLRVTLADEKPEPGVYLFDHRTGEDKTPVWIGPKNATLMALDGSEDVKPWGEYDASCLTPARVVPAEPIEDARASAVDIIEDVLKNHIRVRLNIADTGGPNAHSGTIDQIRHLHLAEPHLPAVEAANRLCDVGVLSALAKHGGARKLPRREEVRDGLYRKLGPWLGDRDRRAVEEAVMELLGGGDRG